MPTPTRRPPHRSPAGRSLALLKRRPAHRLSTWSTWNDERLLDLRLCDLDLRLESTWMMRGIEQLGAELRTRGIRVTPHCWLSSEWFCPDGVPGFAIPFYLAHPRLMRLEQTIMGEVEGGSHGSFMRILRHETGHAIQTAFRLHRRAKWRALFGNATAPYPLSYQPKPWSRNHVLHLDFWYAQSHPVEDFAETFALWLTPRSGWRQRYAGWPALKKLIYVDSLMAEVARSRAPVQNDLQIDPLPSQGMTLREFYRKKRETYGLLGENSVYDNDLRNLFGPGINERGQESASAFLNRHRRTIRERVTRWTPQYDVALDHVLRLMMVRCRRLRLFRADPEEKVLHDFSLLLTARTVKYLHTSRDRYAL
ncbi:MAG: putative zinc-binding metallopeptidase [Deltaproteobacteria bacterium]|nr:putative zinc-binding metallopeptidase [Deltaproteobacteria bacterium]